MQKKILAALLAAAMAASVFSGCGSSGNTSSASTSGAEGAASSAVEKVREPAGDPVEGGILTISLPSSPKYLDPIKYTGSYESQIIRNVCDTLVDYKMDLSEIVPGIATEWSISEDGMEYTFKLREDVFFHPGKFQEGRQVKAEDIKFSLERSATQSSLNRLDMVDHCEVLGDFEVKVVLKSPNAVFLTALTDAGNVIIPKEEVEGWGDEFGAHLVGSGPFMLQEFKLDQETTTLRNEKYWAAKPYLDGVTFKVITDINQTVNALKTGDVLYATSLSGEAVQLVREDPNLDLDEMPGLHVAYIYMNQKNGPTADKRVRDAILMAVDRDDLVKGVYPYGEAQKAWLPLPPGSWGYDATLEAAVPAYNPEEAKKLLAEAGYPDGLSLKIYISNTAARMKMATILQQYLKTNLNIDLEINSNEWGTFSEVASSGNADLYGMSWTWYPDPYFFLNKMFASSEIGALGNGAGFNVPEVDKLLADALLETDQAKRKDMYHQALKLIVEQSAQIDYANENVTCGRNPKVQGMVQRADNVINLCSSQVNVWLSK